MKIELLLLLLLIIKLLILFLHNPNVLCYVILVTSHLSLFICFFVCLLFCINVFFLQYLPVICLLLHVVFVHNVITYIYTALCL
jgi:hypothetical protein